MQRPVPTAAIAGIYKPQVLHANMTNLPKVSAFNYVKTSYIIVCLIDCLEILILYYGNVN